jgi:hypothetical protein
MGVSGLGKCVNPACSTEFKRLGTGKIYTLPVKLPEEWGLPPHVKQKVVWLCGRCSLNKRVEFDVQHSQVLVVSRKEVHKRSA